jgi:hypothetical protein
MASAGVVQFGRAVSLVLGNESGEGLDLSNLRFRFEVSAADVETPNNCSIRVYNPSKETMREAIAEYSSVILNAGYEGNIAQIFKGTIKQFRRGKERNVDSFLDILAADGDLAYNFGLVNVSLAAGTKPEQQVQQLIAGMQKTDPAISLDPNAAFYLTERNFPQPRGKVLFGLAREYMRDVADTNNVRWFIDNGVVKLVPITGYLPGDAIEINSLTGMIGSPEATEQGIIVECLLNPLIKLGTAIKLNNDDITTTALKSQLFPGYTDLAFVAKVESTGADGLYRVIVVEHSGDTRDQEWYSKLICLLIDKSSPADQSVAPYGIAPSR